MSPHGSLFEGDAHYVSAPGYDGLLGVMADHAPLLNVLLPGTVKVRVGEEETFYAIASGILEVNHVSGVLILADEARKAASPQDAAEQLKDIKSRYEPAKLNRN